MLKTKKITNQQKFISLSKQLGIVMLSLGTTLGMIDSPGHTRGVIVPNQPAFAYATINDRSRLHSVHQRDRVGDKLDYYI
jgi:hypothetical protein